MSTTMQDQIDHVVVLMLENRSFDSLLGWLYEKGELPAQTIPKAQSGDEFRGLDSINLQDFINTTSSGLSEAPTRGTSGPTIPSVDPGEEFEHINMQFFGTETPAPDARASMTGVLQDFENVLTAAGYKTPERDELARGIMHSYTPGQLPVLNQLAKHYAVSDEWFASVPSQTNPNRAFLMTGTSHGLTDNGQLETNPAAKELEKVLGMGIGDDRFPDETIFNAVDKAGEDWNVFWQTSYLPAKMHKLLDNAPELIKLCKHLENLPDFIQAHFPRTLHFLENLTTMETSAVEYLKGLTDASSVDSDYTWRLFPQIQNIENAADHFKSFDDFKQLAKAGKLPKFSYIEPEWTIADSTFSARWKRLATQMGNDYHPPCNMMVGENFVREVYESLISNQEAWEKTLLVITFDEFVGSFDHVAPPAAVPPWGDNKPDFDTHGFDFNRYGARVPTILVSPWIEKGTVFRTETDTPYDHTSVISTTLKWMDQSDQIADFGQRTVAAPTFENVLNRSSARTDAAAIGFLNHAHQTGDPVGFDERIYLKNQDGDYLSVSQMAMLAGPSLPAHLMSYAVDLEIAAWFPTIGDGDKAVLTLRTDVPDLPDSISNGSQLRIFTNETSVSGADCLGAWKDSHDCYYFNAYSVGDDIANQMWTVRKVDASGDETIRYGDKVYLENSAYQGQRLSRDRRPLNGKWITTEENGDCWIIEPIMQPDA